MNRRRRQEDTPVNTSQWLTTYGDMVTLLLTFFVMLFAMSTIDAAKFQQMILSIQGTLGINYQGSSINNDALIADGQYAEIDLEEMFENVYPESAELTEEEEMSIIYMRMKNYIDENALVDSVEITKEKPGLLIRFKDEVLFDSGKADLKKESIQILDNLASILKEFDKHIRIEGHTDNVPIHNEEFDSNWELSGQRAANVVKYFIEKNGIEPSRLLFSGYGEYHPVADNSTPDGRQKNRRVDVVVLKEYVSNIIATGGGGKE